MNTKSIANVPRVDHWCWGFKRDHERWRWMFGWAGGWAGPQSQGVVFHAAVHTLDISIAKMFCVEEFRIYNSAPHLQIYTCTICQDPFLKPVAWSDCSFPFQSSVSFVWCQTDTKTRGFSGQVPSLVKQSKNSTKFGRKKGQILCQTKFSYLSWIQEGNQSLCLFQFPHQQLVKAKTKSEAECTTPRHRSLMIRCGVLQTEDNDPSIQPRGCVAVWGLRLFMSDHFLLAPFCVALHVHDFYQTLSWEPVKL